MGYFKEEEGKRWRIVHGDGSEGFEETAPYDRIFSTAGIVDIHSFDISSLEKQLSPAGRILLAQNHGPLLEYRKVNGKLEETAKYGDMSFVPLIKGTA